MLANTKWLSRHVHWIKRFKTLLALWFLSFLSNISYAADGVEYRVAYDTASQTYQVYMRPGVTPGNNTTLAGTQVTLKVPHSNADPFTVTNFAGVAGTWDATPSIVRAPSEDSSYDYLSFDLASTSIINFTASNETLVFTFKNSGACLGAVSLMDANDPFNVDPNSASSNPGQHVAVLGLGGNADGNDWLRNYGGPAQCSGDGVEYRIGYDSASGTYQVYMRATATPTNSTTLAGTQVTVKVPHSTTSPFTVTSFTSVTGSWDSTPSIVRAPSEDTSSDYLSFDLASTGNTNLVGNTEKLMFTFKNAGMCIGDVLLMENTDPFNTDPNSANSNPGQHVAVLGLGGNADGNDWLRNYGGPAQCSPGGVEYRLGYDSATQTYQLYMRATATPTNSTTLAGAQVTVKVPHSNTSPFTVSNFNSVTGA